MQVPGARPRGCAGELSQAVCKAYAAAGHVTIGPNQTSKLLARQWCIGPFCGSVRDLQRSRPRRISRLEARYSRPGTVKGCNCRVVVLPRDRRSRTVPATAAGPVLGPITSHNRTTPGTERLCNASARVSRTAAWRLDLDWTRPGRHLGHEPPKPCPSRPWPERLVRVRSVSSKNLYSPVSACELGLPHFSIHLTWNSCDDSAAGDCRTWCGRDVSVHGGS